MNTPNSVAIHVEDACGFKYCVSYRALAYEAAGIKHARWWMRQRQIGTAVRPLRLVVERYCDPSSSAA